MSKNIDTKGKCEEYEVMRDAYWRELVLLTSQVKLYIHLIEKFNENKKLRSCSPFFWYLTLDCYWRSIVLGITKLILDPNGREQSLTISYFLDKASDLEVISEELKAELKVQADEISEKFKQLREVRDKKIAHFDNDVIKGKTIITYSYSFVELKELVDEIFAVFNRVSIEYEDMQFHNEIDKLYDVDFALDCLSTMLEIYDARDWKSIKNILGQFDPSFNFLPDERK